jgi:hypothetical protein
MQVPNKRFMQLKGEAGTSVENKLQLLEDNNITPRNQFDSLSGSIK